MSSSNVEVKAESVSNNTNEMTTSSGPTSKTHKLSPFHKWTPYDDFLLVKSIEKNMDIEEITNSIKFSYPFNKEEITSRWKEVLYDPILATQTAKNITILQNVKNYKRVPWSNEENQIIFREIETHGDVPLNFELIYDKYRHCFHPSRNPKTLEAHYQRMRRKGLLKGYFKNASILQQQLNKTEDNITENSSIGSSSTIKVNNNNSIITNNEELEVSLINNSMIEEEEEDDLNENKTLEEIEEEILNKPHHDVIYEDTNNSKKRKQLKDIHRLEKENEQDEYIKEPKKKKSEGEEVLAILDGTQAKIQVLKPVSTVGRKNSNFTVDIDLSTESEDVGKISRKQAILTLNYKVEEIQPTKTVAMTGLNEDMSDRYLVLEESVEPEKKVNFTFTLKNVGKRDILVNGEKIESNSEKVVPHQSLIQFPGGLKFVFKYNYHGLDEWYSLKQ
ncbi:hypothetical protein ABK040_009117 [Willaertia magna]